MPELSPDDLDNLEFAEIFEDDPDAVKVLCDASCLFSFEEGDLFPTVRYHTVKFVTNLITRGDYVVIFNDCALLTSDKLATTLHQLGVAFNHVADLNNRLAACQEEAVDLVMTTNREEAEALRGSYKVVLLSVEEGVENITDMDAVKTDDVDVVKDNILNPIERVTRPTSSIQRAKLKQLCLDNPICLAFTPLIEDVETLLQLLEQLSSSLPEEMSVAVDELLLAFDYGLNDN